MISIIIPLYNKEKSIFRTIQSVLTQSHRDFELIIVNDGSTDRGFAVACEIKDSRIIFIDKNNGGVSSARNIGILRATSEYIAFLDADDIWLPNHLQVLSSLIDEHSGEAVLFATRFNKVNCLSDVKVIQEERPNKNIISDYFEEASKPYSLLSSSSFAVKKSTALSNGMFNEELTYGEDVEFWYRVLKVNSLALSSQLTVFYYTGSENRSDIKVVPLKNRFCKFNFYSASKSEKKYLGKLFFLIMLDYFRLRAYLVVIKVFWRYKKYFFYALIYFISLINKKIFSL